MTAPADRPPKGPPPDWAYTPRHEPPPADQAVCTPADADRLLYPQGVGTQPHAIIDEARELCRSCPVQTWCLDYALTADERYGVWGGCTEKERADLRERHRLKPARQPPLPTLPVGLVA